MQTLALSNIGQCFLLFLEISPARTTIAGGSTINITCTLHNASTSEFNVTDFYFYNTSDGSFISDNVTFGDDAAWYTYHATHSNITRELNISCGIHDTQWDAHATITVNGMKKNLGFTFIVDLISV